MELQGRNAYFYKQTEYKHSDGEIEYTRIDDIDDHSDLFVVCTPCDQGKTIPHYPKDIISCYDIKRSDPILVQVVEELGREASGSYSGLRVVEVEKVVGLRLTNMMGSKASNIETLMTSGFWQNERSDDLSNFG